MKKHVLLAAALCMTAVMATACGSKHTQTQETAAETTTEASDAETKAADTTKPDLSNVDPKMAEGPGAFETDESSEGVQVEEISGAIGKVDVDTLEPVMAGIVLGDGVPNIILGITVDGELAITGMNY